MVQQKGTTYLLEDKYMTIFYTIPILNYAFLNLLAFITNSYSLEVSYT